MEVGHEDNPAHARTDCSEDQKGRSVAGRAHVTGRSDLIARGFTPDLTAPAHPIRRDQTRRRGEAKESRKGECSTQAALGREGAGQRHAACSPRENGDPESNASGRCPLRGRIRSFATPSVLGGQPTLQRPASLHHPQ